MPLSKAQDDALAAKLEQERLDRLADKRLVTGKGDPQTYHERRRAERMRDPEFRAAYEQAAGERRA